MSATALATALPSRQVLIALVTAIALWLAGALVLALCRPRRPRSHVERIATELSLGLAVVPALWVALTVLAGPPTVALGRGVLIALALGGLAARAVVRSPGTVRDRERWRPAHVAGMALLVLLAVAALFNAATAPMHHFDSVFHFAWKGKLLFGEGLATDAWTGLDGDVGRVMTHPTYPPGIPALHAVTACVGGRFEADATRALCGLFAVAPALLLFAALRPRGRGAALSAALLWLSLPILLYISLPHDQSLLQALRGLLTGVEWTQPLEERARVPHEFSRPDGSVMDGAGDLPLAALWFGAALHLARSVPGASWRRDRADGLVSGLLLGGAMLAKNEGLGLAAVLALAYVLACVASPAGRRLAALAPLVLALALGALLFLPWVLGQGAIPTIDEGYASELRLDVLVQRRARAPAIAHEFQRTLSSFPHWGLLWPLFLGTVLWGLTRPRRLFASGALLPVLLVLGGLALYFAVLMVTPWVIANLFRTAIPDRLFVPLAPAAAFAVVAMGWPAPRPPEQRPGESP